MDNMQDKRAEDEGRAKDESPEPDSSSWKQQENGECQKWKAEIDRFEEVIEYMREVEDILNLMRPSFEGKKEQSANETKNLCFTRVESNSETSGTIHFENIIKLVDKLKKLQEAKCNVGSGNNSLYEKYVRKLKQHKERLNWNVPEFQERKAMDNIQRMWSLSTEIPTNTKFHGSRPELVILQDPTEEQEPFLPTGDGLYGNKSKVSKWTKVKEAFQWERVSSSSSASAKCVTLKEQPSFVENRTCILDLPAPSGTYHSGKGPLGRSPPTATSYLLPSTHLNYLHSTCSSDDSRLNEYLSFLAVLKENRTPDVNSSNQMFVHDDNYILTKSLSTDDFALFPYFSQNLSKDNLQEEFSSTQLMKSNNTNNKTTWGKVKDIIQTRKEGLKRRPKVRTLNEECQRMRRLSSPLSFAGQTLPKLSLNDFPTTPPGEGKTGNPVELQLSKCKNPSAKSPEDFPFPLRKDKISTKSSPSLTLSLPSSAELSGSSYENLDKKGSDSGNSSGTQNLSCQAQYFEDKSKHSKNQRLSRWINVKKKAFVTSTSPLQSSPDISLATTPTEPSKQETFFSDVESDLSSGEYIDDGVTNSREVGTKHDVIDLENNAMTVLQEDIKKSYSELQKKLSLEFDDKLREWKLKNDGPIRPDETNRMNATEGGNKFSGTRDSVAIQFLPSINDLSPEFKKKLDDWKKIKGSRGLPVVNVITKDELPAKNLKMKIAEWQNDRKWRKGQQERQDKDVTGDVQKRTRRGRAHSSGDNLAVATCDKDSIFNRKPKDYQWVEKELQKVEREKLRLEQEMKKFMEKEAKLKRLQRTMGTAKLPKQEILVRTPTGYIRFKGISQKFTKRLYEWEKAKGIGPEASTFALLEENASATDSNLLFRTAERDISVATLKFRGSVPELSSLLAFRGGLVRHTSSLSLNDVDDLKSLKASGELVESFCFDESRNEKIQGLAVDAENVEQETDERFSYKNEVPVCECEPHEPLEPPLQERFPIDNDIKCIEFDESSSVRKNFASENAPLCNFWAEKESLRNSKHSLNGICNENLSLEPPMNLYVAKDKTEKNTTDLGTTGIEPEPSLFVSDSEGRHQSTLSQNAYTVTDVEMDRTKRALCCLPEKKGDDTSHSQVGKVESVKPKRLDRRINGSTQGVQKRVSKSAQNLETLESNSGKPTAHETQNSDSKNSNSSVSTSVSVSTARDFTDGKNISTGNGNHVNVFVPTTRKIISPVKTHGLSPTVCSYVIDDVRQTVVAKEEDSLQTIDRSTSRKSVSQGNKLGCSQQDAAKLPPFPSLKYSGRSQVPKETSPSIKMIIEKYNKKISERNGGKENGGAVGSVKSRTNNIFGRPLIRVSECPRQNGGDQTGCASREIQKSASFESASWCLQSPREPSPSQSSTDRRTILKSSSIGTIKTMQAEKSVSEIQEAKEGFLSGKHSLSADDPAAAPLPKPQFQQVKENFKKSISTGAIASHILNSTSEDKQQQQRQLQQNKFPSKFDISNIKLKFQNIGTRREKENKGNSVMALCRQSLMIQVADALNDSSTEPSIKSCPSSPVIKRKGQT